MTTNESVPGKETVVRRRGADWSFHVPNEHRIEVDREARFVVLSAGEGEDSIYELDDVEETESEVIVKLGPEAATTPVVGSYPGPIEWPSGYPLPEVQDEFERLHERWRSSGLPEEEFRLVTQGGTDWGARNELHLGRLRARLRDAAGA